MNKRLFITGGHITPAIAVAEAIRKKDADVQMYLVGREYTLEKEKTASQEQELARGAGIEFLPITAGRVTRTVTLTSFIGILKVPLGFVHAGLLLWKYRPQVILSFGGYIALPIATIGKLMGAAVVTHEQTSVPGLTNRIIARFADRVCVSYQDQISTFGKDKTTYTGLPIRSGLYHPPRKSPFAFADDRPVLYVTGGSTGAKSINSLLYPILKSLLQTFDVIHQTGELSFNEAASVRDMLPEDLRGRYVVSSYLSTQEVAWILRHATLAVGRSGANTVGEFSALGVPAIYIPLPWSAGGEQDSNARRASETGVATVLTQNGLTPDGLLEHINAFYESIGTHNNRDNKYGTAVGSAASDVADAVLEQFT